ncbi:43486_t:CDS:2, partial [Gigaspora margarita]
MSCSNVSEKYPKWLREEQDKGNIVVFEHTLFRNINFIGKEETVVEEFITNKNRKTIPILTRNGTSNLFSVGPSVQMLNEPSLKNLKKSSSNELIAQGLI